MLDQLIKYHQFKVGLKKILVKGDLVVVEIELVVLLGILTEVKVVQYVVVNYPLVEVVIAPQEEVVVAPQGQVFVALLVQLVMLLVLMAFEKVINIHVIHFIDFLVIYQVSSMYYYQQSIYLTIDHQQHR